MQAMLEMPGRAYGPVIHIIHKYNPFVGVYLSQKKITLLCTKIHLCIK